jgi:hypothetical protein
MGIILSEKTNLNNFLAYIRLRVFYPNFRRHFKMRFFCRTHTSNANFKKKYLTVTISQFFVCFYFDDSILWFYLSLLTILI